MLRGSGSGRVEHEQTSGRSGASCVAGEAVVRWARCLVLNSAVNQRTLPG